MSQPARFGRLARLYRWMEYFSFGPYLAECRLIRLRGASACRRALVYGDGDGRFVASLAGQAPQTPIVVVDASAEMLAQTARRLPRANRVRLLNADALAFDPAGLAEAPFDLVVSHFFLDCFSETEIAALLSRVEGAVSGNAIWIVSDFAIPQRAPAKHIATLIVHALYLAFGLLTRLKTRRLPDHGRVMRDAGWSLEDRQELLFGLLISERWRRSC